MHQRVCLSVVLSLFGVVAFAIPAFAQEIPTQIDLETDISVGGRFRIFTTFRNAEGDVVRVNRRDRCRIAFVANISESGDVTAGTRRIGALRLRKGRPNGVSYVARRLRPVRDQGGDSEEDAIITAQARLICGRGENSVEIVSNASARFIICGRAQPADAPGQFLRRVAQQGSSRALRNRDQ